MYETAIVNQIQHMNVLYRNQHYLHVRPWSRGKLNELIAKALTTLGFRTFRRIRHI